jgi:uncharacterized protein (DUF433 family)
MDKSSLIEKYIEPAADPGEARLFTYGVSVWALVGYWRAVKGDVDQVARDYALPPDAVQAALAYYEWHREAIDAVLASNAA